MTSTPKPQLVSGVNSGQASSSMMKTAAAAGSRTFMTPTNRP
jgi:hypothetical protein